MKKNVRATHGRQGMYTYVGNDALDKNPWGWPVPGIIDLLHG